MKFVLFLSLYAHVSLSFVSLPINNAQTSVGNCPSRRAVTTQVTIGNQKFSFVLDTGSKVTTVNTIHDNTAKSAGVKPRFGKMGLQIKGVDTLIYADGSSVTGEYVEVEVQVGTLSPETMQILAVFKETGIDHSCNRYSGFADNTTAGVLGLGRFYPSTTLDVPRPYQNLGVLRTNNRIWLDNPLQPPIFAISPCYSTGGLLFLGMPIQQPPVNQVNLKTRIQNGVELYDQYYVPVLQIKIGTTQINPTSFVTHLDMGSPVTRFPTAVYRAIVNLLQSNYNQRFQSIRAFPASYTSKLFEQNCFESLRDPRYVNNLLPSMTVILGAADLTAILEIPPVGAYLQLSRIYEVNRVKHYTYCAALGESADDGVLGAPLLSTLMTVYNLETQSLSFSKKTNCPSNEYTLDLPPALPLPLTQPYETIQIPASVGLLLADFRQVMGASSNPYTSTYTKPAAPLGIYESGNTTVLLQCSVN